MIEKNFNEVALKSEQSAVALIGILYAINERNPFSNAAVYHRFPVYPHINDDGNVTANVVFLSRHYGIIIFECIEVSQRTTNDFSQSLARLTEIDRLIFSKILKEAPNLQRDRRALKINITPVVFVFGDDAAKIQAMIPNFEVVSTIGEITDLILRNIAVQELTELEYKELKAAFEGSKAIPRISDRSIRDLNDLENSKGAILSKIENEIYNFDLEQKRAALFVVDGPQRIRGLAGSGKTVILAMKAAMIHLNDPNVNILYTYYTKSLHDLVRKLITRFYRQFADRDPNWERIKIMHAWGGKALEGVYYNTSKANGLTPINLSDARVHNKETPFDYVCEQLNQVKLKKEYDYSLLDEAQDFPKHFYRVCRQITRNNRVIWAYDDFQNILEIDLQDEKETFGRDERGEYYVDFARRPESLQDLVLHKCYRSPRKVLISAFSLGLGIYNSVDGGFRPIQRLESNEHWESLGFSVLKGDSSDNSEMEIERPIQNSSRIKNELLDARWSVNVYKASTLAEEVDFVVNQIMDDLRRELRPEDVTVICLDNFNAKGYFDAVTNRLQANAINTFNLLKAPTSNTVFKVKNHVTLTTIFSAKGNEVGSVYIIGIDTVFTHKNDITERNKVFTAMTRSLGWVTMSGIGDSVQDCIDELAVLSANGFKLNFKQPSSKDVKTIRQGIDMTQKMLNKFERMAEELERETGLTRDAIVQQLKIKFVKKEE